MAGATPLPETSAACRKVGKPWESGFALMTGADARRIGAGKAKGRAGNGRCLWQMIVPVGYSRFTACRTSNALPKTTYSDLL